MLFNEKITLYNHYKDINGKDRWKRTLLNGCMCFDKVVKTVNDRGLVNVSKVVEVTIILQDGYKAPKSWGQEGWTLNTTNNLDLIVRGNCTFELNNTEDLKTLRKNEDVKTIAEVSDNTNQRLLKHWRVIAK